jgi:hypothetical protein
MDMLCRLDAAIIAVSQKPAINNLIVPQCYNPRLFNGAV